MSTRKVTSQGFFQTLTIIWAAMVMSNISIASVGLYMQFSGELPPSDPDMTGTLLIVLAGVAAAAVGASIVLVNGLLARAADKPTLSDKLRGYQTANIIRFALLEAPSILGLVGMINTGELLFVSASAVSVAALVLFRPTKERAIESLRLSGTDQRMVEDPKAIVMEYEVTSAD